MRGRLLARVVCLRALDLLGVADRCPVEIRHQALQFADPMCKVDRYLRSRRRVRVIRPDWIV